MRTENTTSSAGTFMFGMLCGAAAGVAIGMLFAPKPGADLRRELADQAERLRQQAKDQSEWLRRQASEMCAGASGTMTDMMARGREAYNTGREAFERARPHNGHAGDIGMP